MACGTHSDKTVFKWQGNDEPLRRRMGPLPKGSTYGIRKEHRVNFCVMGVNGFRSVGFTVMLIPYIYLYYVSSFVSIQYHILRKLKHLFHAV